MEHCSYKELMEEVDRLFTAEKYSVAMDLTKGASMRLTEEEYVENYFILMYTQEILANRLDLVEEHLGILKELVDGGYACSDYMFNRHRVKNDPRFMELKKRNDLLLEQLREASNFRYEVHLPVSYSTEKRHPVVFALHGDGGDGNIEGLKTGWKPEPFLNRDFIVVYVQSSQVWCHNGYAWLPDLAVARRELKGCYQDILKSYCVNEDRIYIGGYSGGAIASLDIAMTNTIPVAGFIALCPEIKKESFTLENVLAARDRGLRGVILEGEMMIPVADEVEMMKILDETGFPYEFYINKGIGHDIPKDFSKKMDRALDFILEHD